MSWLMSNPISRSAFSCYSGLQPHTNHRAPLADLSVGFIFVGWNRTCATRPNPLQQSALDDARRPPGMLCSNPNIVPCTHVRVHVCARACGCVVLVSQFRPADWSGNLSDVLRDVVSQLPIDNLIWNTGIWGAGWPKAPLPATHNPTYPSIFDHGVFEVVQPAAFGCSVPCSRAAFCSWLHHPSSPCLSRSLPCCCNSSTGAGPIDIGLSCSNTRVCRHRDDRS